MAIFGDSEAENERFMREIGLRQMKPGDIIPVREPNPEGTPIMVPGLPPLRLYPSTLKREPIPMNPTLKWPPFTQEMLNDLIDKTIKETAELMKLKGAEYAHGSDRLDNFRRNAANIGVQPETVWMIYATKHWDSITTYVRDLQSGVERNYSEPIVGRFHDMINYCLLGIAMEYARRLYRQDELKFPEPPASWSQAPAKSAT